LGGRYRLWSLHGRTPPRSFAPLGSFTETVERPFQAGDSAADADNARGFALVRPPLNKEPPKSLAGITPKERLSWDENGIAGTARNLGGKAQKSFGRVTGDAKTEPKA
jgi:hypothetical protein